MDFARRNGFVVVTHDLDFGAILTASRGEKPSVIQIRADDLRPETVGRRILAALRVAESEVEAGALVTVTPGKTRISVLPLPGRN